MISELGYVEMQPHNYKYISQYVPVILKFTPGCSNKVNAALTGNIQPRHNITYFCKLTRVLDQHLQVW